ncbi:MAG: hypothetical protein ACFHXK_07455 [bacterium]
MSRSQLVMCSALVGVLLLGSGCAHQPPANSLAQLQQENVKELSMMCYWHHDGERIVAGSAEVFLACRRWAQKYVQARFPQSGVVSSTTALHNPD